MYIKTETGAKLAVHGDDAAPLSTDQSRASERAPVATPSNRAPLLVQPLASLVPQQQQQQRRQRYTYAHNPKSATHPQPYPHGAPRPQTSDVRYEQDSDNNDNHNDNRNDEDEHDASDGEYGGQAYEAGGGPLGSLVESSQVLYGSEPETVRVPQPHAPLASTNKITRTRHKRVGCTQQSCLETEGS